jgi:hypothetical protein
MNDQHYILFLFAWIVIGALYYGCVRVLDSGEGSDFFTDWVCKLCRFLALCVIVNVFFYPYWIRGLDSPISGGIRWSAWIFMHFFMLAALTGLISFVQTIAVGNIRRELHVKYPGGYGISLLSILVTFLILVFLHLYSCASRSTFDALSVPWCISHQKDILTGICVLQILNVSILQRKYSSSIGLGVRSVNGRILYH